MEKQELLEKLKSCMADGEVWGIVIENVATKDRITCNGEIPFNAASIIKVPIMAAVYADVYEKGIQLDERIEIKQSDLAMGSGIIQFLNPGMSMTIYDLIVLMIITSDNTATNILINLLGIERINEIMIRLGMRNSKLEHQLGHLYTGQNHKNIITADDVATMLSKISDGSFLHRYACQEMISIMQKQLYRDGIPRHFPSHYKQLAGQLPIWEFANKTGWVQGIQHDVGILQTAHIGVHTITVLAQYEGTQGQVLERIAAIGQYAYSYIASNV